MTLTDAIGSVTGTGTIAQAAETFQLSIIGTSANGSFTLTISVQQHEPFSYSGTIQATTSGTVLTGVANGSGFNNDAMTLRRQ